MTTNFKLEDIARRYSEGILAEELSLKPRIMNFIKHNALKNKKVLDLGCGDGGYSLIFAKRGARVIGVDKSKHQIAIANNIHKHPKIRYILGNAKNLDILKKKSIDLVFMNMLLPNLKSKRDLKILIREVKRVLKRKGKVVITALHPLYFSYSKDKLDRPLGLKKDFHLKDGLKFSGRAITNKSNKIIFNDTYFSPNFISRVLSENGFVINNIVESLLLPECNLHQPKYLLISGQIKI